MAVPPTLVSVRRTSMIYLYHKIHNKTGMQYLGKTSGDPYRYHGSGKLWVRHLKAHGTDLTTHILFQTEDKEEFKRVALYYSKLWNIVESKDWANLTLEEGQGGATNLGRKFPPMKEETRAKLRGKKGPRGPQKNPRKPGYKRGPLNLTEEARAKIGRRGIPRGPEAAKKSWETRRARSISAA